MNKIQEALLIEAKNNIDNNPIYAAELLNEVLADEDSDLKIQLKKDGVGWVEMLTRAYKQNAPIKFDELDNRERKPDIVANRLYFNNITEEDIEQITKDVDALAKKVGIPAHKGKPEFIKYRNTTEDLVYNIGIIDQSDAKSNDIVVTFEVYGKDFKF